jgi:hypothetical protein
MHILVPWGETTLDASGFFLTTKYNYYAKGDWGFDAEAH